VELTDLDVHKENGVESEDAVKTTDLKFSLRRGLKARDGRATISGTTVMSAARVNHSPKLVLKFGSRRRSDRDSSGESGRQVRRFVGRVVRQAQFQVHRISTIS
jgi:hypothetical protein